jgi:hypothetical protein
MKRAVVVLPLLFFFWASPGHGGLLEDLGGKFGLTSPATPRDDQVAAGLKEALSIGTGNAVAATSKVDGYFKNAAIKILLPEKVRKAGDILARVGYQEEVDEFVLSMNRAAETAAPQAKAFFVDAIRQMTIEDARKILDGGDTAATEFFKSKTFAKMYEAFKPTVASSMNQVGVTRSYKKMMDKYAGLPFADSESLDLDRYVTTKALDGIFYMVGQEEMKIRKDPAARVTELLKRVFGDGSSD